MLPPVARDECPGMTPADRPREAAAAIVPALSPARLLFSRAAKERSSLQGSSGVSFASWLEMRDHPLDGLGSRFPYLARQLLERRGVEVRLGTAVEASAHGAKALDTIGPSVHT